MLDKDPLYLFTETTADDFILNVFEHYLSPLLDYVQEIYSSPISLDDARILPLSKSVPDCETKIKSSNYSYGRNPQKIKLSDEEIWKSIVALFPSRNWPTPTLYLTNLTVKVPNSKNHSFWQNCTSFEWKADQSAIELQVARWGPTVEGADYYATQRAKDIIRCVRKHLTGIVFSSPPLPIRIINFNPQDCRACFLGTELHEMWRIADSGFAWNSHGFWEFAIKKLDIYIIKFPEFRVLLKYYQVFYHYVQLFIVDIFIYSDKAIRRLCDITR